MKRFACLIALCLGFAVGVQAGPANKAEAAMQELQAATVALAEAEGAQDRVAALTQTVQAYESGLAALREGLRQAAIKESAIKGVFDAESGRLAQLLGVLQSIEAAPEPHLLLHPQGPLGTVRSGMILSEVTPAISREASALRRALQEIATLRALQEASISTLEEGLTGVQQARTRLSKAISSRTSLPRRLITDKVAMENLLSSADTLESFATGLLSATVVDTSVVVEQPDILAAKGTLEMPVRGRVLRGFNESDAAGVRRPGWIVAARPLSLVTTPWPATIRYLGPLLDYGQVAILEPGEGTFLVLAGLGRLFGSVGEVLPKGAAIGLMGGVETPGDQPFLISAIQGSGTGASESLYVELRRNGSPEDPATWFAGIN